MNRVVVIGHSWAALQAAAWFASAGHCVRVVGGDPAPDSRIPFGLGAVPGGRTQALDRLWGTVIPFPGGGPTQAVWARGTPHKLPLSPTALVRLWGPPAVARTYAQRVGRRLRTQLGLRSGDSDRAPTLHTWAHHHGGCAVAHAIDRQAIARLAASSHTLAAELGGWLCNASASEPWVVPGLAPTEQRQALVNTIYDSGGDILEDVCVEALEVNNGKVVSVLTQVGREHADWVVTDARPAQLLSWLPPHARNTEVSELIFRFAHAVQVTLPAQVESLPYLCYFSQGLRPFWGLTRPGLIPGGAPFMGQVTAHCTVPETSLLWAASDATWAHAIRVGLPKHLGTAPPKKALVQRFAHAVPLVGPAQRPSWNRWLHTCDALGIVAVGAAHGWLGHDGQAAAYLQAIERDWLQRTRSQADIAQAVYAYSRALRLRRAALPPAL